MYCLFWSGVYESTFNTQIVYFYLKLEFNFLNISHMDIHILTCMLSYEIEMIIPVYNTLFLYHTGGFVDSHLQIKDVFFALLEIMGWLMRLILKQESFQRNLKSQKSPSLVWLSHAVSTNSIWSLVCHNHSSSCMQLTLETLLIFQMKNI